MSDNLSAFIMQNQLKNSYKFLRFSSVYKIPFKFSVQHCLIRHNSNSKYHYEIVLQQSMKIALFS